MHKRGVDMLPLSNFRAAAGKFSGDLRLALPGSPDRCSLQRPGRLSSTPDEHGASHTREDAKFGTRKIEKNIPTAWNVPRICPEIFEENAKIITMRLR